MSETETVQEQKKKKKLTPEQIAKKIAEKKMKSLVRKRTRYYRTNFDYKEISKLLPPDVKVLMKDVNKLYQNQKLIFNLLAKALLKSQGKRVGEKDSNGYKVGLRCKYASTKEGISLADHIKIRFRNKYDFTIEGIAGKMSPGWLAHFKYILEVQYNRTPTVTKRNRVILEKDW